MARPRTGRETPAEYQRRYRERKKTAQTTTQTNWMLDSRLTDAIRKEAKRRKIHESQLVGEVLTQWYVAQFKKELPPFDPPAPVPPVQATAPEDEINSFAVLLMDELQALGFTIPLAGQIVQRLRGDASNGLTSSITVTESGAGSIEFGLTERVEGAAVNVLHCVVDTQMQEATTWSETRFELNGTRLVDIKLAALKPAFDYLREFLTARRVPLQVRTILESLAINLDTSLSVAMMAKIFERAGLEFALLPPTRELPADLQPSQLAVHDLAELSAFARQELETTGKTLLRLEMVNGGELMVFTPESRQAAHEAVKQASKPKRKGTDA